MRVCFWYANKARERILASAFAEGLSRYPGDSIELREITAEKEVAGDCEVSCMVGVKSRELYQMHRRAGMRLLYLDKGYTRHRGHGVNTWEYWRVSLNGHHPTQYLHRINARPERAKSLGLDLRPWRESGEHIVLAGSSQKYHDFYGLPDPTQYAQKIVKRIRRLTDRPIVYRPKPSWKEAVPIDGTKFSNTGSIMDVLKDAHALVTHGSNACFEAVMMGVPCVVLGDAVAKPLSSTDLEDIENPRLATMEERVQWLSDLAYCQWTLEEMASGEAWRNIRPLIYA